ncbi:1-phosphatidylinositol 3-phosphate 5-kinase fab1 [Brevipalpus obovatus]|uniref:1-phosphatidylinositol 3-phosphate 5-kinase fab1 n=1 Tax=Brevipalpus obovatus TaxID=246614 RepID=UPI003D9F582D
MSFPPHLLPSSDQSIFRKNFNRQDTLSATSAFEIELDSANERVSAFKHKKENDDENLGELNLSDLEIINSTYNCEEEQVLLNHLLNPEQNSVSDTIKQECEKDFDIPYEKLFRNLLSQMLKEDELSSAWITPLINLAKTIASSVKPNTAFGEKFHDIRNFVKVKRILAGNKNDYILVNGLVFTKDVIHRKMKRSIEYPKILLLACPIVYPGVEREFTTIDCLTFNERSYFKGLITKIIRYKPDIVVVDKMVCRTAQEMFLSYGITLVSNIKSKLLEKLSLFAGANVIPSLDTQIGSSDLGVCRKFYTQNFHGSKTLMFFESNYPALGCTVVLRGSSSLKELEKIKDICLFAIFCQYNWNLERCLLSDMLAEMPNGTSTPILNESFSSCDEHIIEKSSSKHESSLSSSETKLELELVTIADGSDPLTAMAISEEAPCDSNLSSPILDQNSQTRSSTADLSLKLTEYLDQAILSCSPFLSYEVPYFLSKDCEDCPLKNFVNFDSIHWTRRLGPLNQRRKSRDDVLQAREIKTNKSDLHPFFTRDLRCELNSPKTLSLLADFRACGSQIPKKFSIRSTCPPDTVSLEGDIFIDALDPRFHQRLPVLYSSFAMGSSSTFCDDPNIIMIEYYGDCDISLGAFLHHYCFSLTQSCPLQSCDRSAFDHVRKFVHEKGCLSISLKQLQHPLVNHSKIVTFSRCQKCELSGPVSVLREKANLLSFGKYLELKFYGKKFGRRKFGHYQSCPHSLFCDHMQYFVHKNIMACFRFESIDIHAVVLPPPRIRIISNELKEKNMLEKDGFKSYRERIENNLNKDDLGSIIAYAMLLPEYEKALGDTLRGASSPTTIKNKFLASLESSASSILSSTAPNLAETLLDGSASSVMSSNLKMNNVPTTNSPVELRFNKGNTKFSCSIYFPDLFLKIRSEFIDLRPDRSNIPNDFSSPISAILSNNRLLHSFTEEMFVNSLSSCVPWTATGGKSGATFYKTSDDRFILKEMSQPELQSFLKIAKFYFDHIMSALIDQRPTLFAKIFGVYKISYKDSVSNTSSKMYLLVMENLFYERNITLKFDLKGSDRNRLASNNSQTDDVVLMDENLTELVQESPLYIRHHSKEILINVINHDSLFLASHSVMDYSLLVGIDESKKQFVLGIIDYIRPYTWDKKIENVVKSVGGNKMPTVVSPNLYRERFCDKMSRYFLCVPDRWYGFESPETITKSLDS